MSDDLASLADEIDHIADRGGTPSVHRAHRLWLHSVADRLRIAIDALPSGGADQEDADPFAAAIEAAVCEQEAIDAQLVGGLVPSERERLNVRWQWLESVLDWIDELRAGAPSTDPAPEPPTCSNCGTPLDRPHAPMGLGACYIGEPAPPAPEDGEA